MDNNLIIDIDDPRYGKLGHIYSKINKSNYIYSTDKHNGIWFYIPYELVINEYITSSMAILKIKDDTWEWNNWVNIKSLKSVLIGCCNLSDQDYYDLIVLHENNKLNRPRCKVCHELVPFNGAYNGYKGVTCSYECSRYYIAHYINEVNLDELDRKLQLHYKIDNNIITNSDLRYKFLGILKKYNWNNIYYYEGYYNVKYFIPPELVVYPLETNSHIIKSIKDYSKGNSYDNWVDQRSFRKILLYSCRLTIQEYFDLLILHINNIQDRPKCKFCKNSLHFRGMSVGYGGDGWNINSINQFCSTNCSTQYTLTHPEEYPEFNKSRFENSYGKWTEHYSSKLHKSFKTRSLIEDCVATSFDDDPDIESYEYEPEGLWIQYINPYTNKYSYYKPDFKVYYKSGDIHIIEVKYHNDINDDQVIAKQVAAIAYCKQFNWTYRFITELDMM